MKKHTLTGQAVRVAGTLDTISASRADILLTLEDGTKLPGRCAEHDLDTLQQLFGRHVVVSGMARYRPSGRCLLVDVESIEPARDEDRLFARVPQAPARRPLFVPLAQDQASGVPAFFGTWPGDETDAELLGALQAIG